MWRFLLWLLVIYLLSLIADQVAVAFIIVSVVLWLVSRHAARYEDPRRG